MNEYGITLDKMIIKGNIWDLYLSKAGRKTMVQVNYQRSYFDLVNADKFDAALQDLMGCLVPMAMKPKLRLSIIYFVEK